MNDIIKLLISKFSGGHLTDNGVKVENSESREVLTPPTREVATSKKPVMDSLACPYCDSTSFQKRGFRQKKHEKIQLYLCLDCRKTFTPQITKGKHYPLAVMLDAISIYNLGYSLEETCRIVNRRVAESNKKATSREVALDGTVDSDSPDTTNSVSPTDNFVNSGGEPGNRTLTLAGRTVYQAVSGTSRIDSPTKSILTHMNLPNLQSSTLSNWISETEPLCRYCQMRPYVMQKYHPRDVVIHATLAHRQLYRYRFHRGKCQLLINHEYRHRRFRPLAEFLEAVPAECPHHYFSAPLPKLAEVDGKVPADVILRASQAPLTFSKKQMIVRAKTNYATKLAAFVLQSVTDRKQRHEAVQKFMLANDSVTVASEVPVYITGDDLEHMKTQLGFEIYTKSAGTGSTTAVGNIGTGTPAADIDRSLESKSLPEAPPPIGGADIAEVVEMAAAELPKLITGHIDILQIRNGMVHILDFKPRAEKERPIEQLTLYAMALSRLTGLRLFEFKCAWFDEKDYFEFFPLHVLYKPVARRRRKNVATKEGRYRINQNWKKIDSVRPEAI